MNKEYWEEYYKKHTAPTVPSSFAEFCLPYMEQDKVLLELGCGNGRDSLYFSSKGINVIAIDQSESEMKRLHEASPDNIIFKAADMIYDKGIYIPNFIDYFYSRFTLHAIGEKEQLLLLRNVANTLKDNGLFFIEVRSTNDDIYGLGEPVERNAYIYNDHYRRFIDFEEFKQMVQDYLFEIEYATEAKDLAPYKDSNPTLIRMVLRKKA